MSTTAVNNFDLTKGSAKIGKLHVDKILIGSGGDSNGGWRSYTPTIGGGTAGAGTSLTSRYRVDGTTLHVVGTLADTTADGTSTGIYTFTMPPGCIAASNSFCVGPAFVLGVTTNGVGFVTAGNTTTFSLRIQNSATTSITWGDSAAADLKLSSGTSLTAYWSFQCELSPTSPVLVGTL